MRLLERSFDIERINGLVNNPVIRPHIGGDGESFIDLSDAVDDRGNWFLIGEHGGFSCCWTGPGVFEVHTFIETSGRGAWAKRAAIEGSLMMREAGAWMLWTRVQPDAENVRLFTLAAGMKPEGQHTLMGVTYDIFARRFPCQQQ